MISEPEHLSEIALSFFMIKFLENKHFSCGAYRKLLGVFLSLLCFTPVLRGAVLIDTLENGNDSSDSISNTSWIADSFTTTANDFILDTVELKLGNNGSTGNFQVDLYTSTGTTPNAFVTTLTTKAATELASSGFATLTISSISQTLAASTEYFIVLRGVSLSGNIKWSYNNGNSGADYAQTANSGGLWTTPGFDPNNFRVTAVPEPEVYTLIFALVLLGVFFQRHKLKASSSQ